MLCLAVQILRFHFVVQYFQFDFVHYNASKLERQSERRKQCHLPSKSALEQEFEDACLSDVEQCSKLGYYPHYFVEMVHQHGAVETAKRLIGDERVPPASRGCGR
jgi:hypothetical protein